MIRKSMTFGLNRDIYKTQINCEMVEKHPSLLFIFFASEIVLCRAKQNRPKQGKRWLVDCAVVKSPELLMSVVPRVCTYSYVHTYISTYAHEGVENAEHQ